MNTRKRHEKLTSTLGTAAPSFTKEEKALMKKYGLNSREKFFVLSQRFLPNQKPQEITGPERKTLDAIKKKLPDMVVIELCPGDEKL